MKQLIAHFVWLTVGGVVLYNCVCVWTCFNSIFLFFPQVDSRDWTLNGNTISLDKDTVIDVPQPFVNTKRYCASLGHKANHSFIPNCKYDTWVQTVRRKQKKMLMEDIYVFQKKESNFENESLIAPTAKLLLKCTGTQTVTNYRLLIYYWLNVYFLAGKKLFQITLSLIKK